MAEYLALIERFLLYLAAERGLSANYRLSIRQSLRRFAAWCAEQSLAPHQLTTRHLTKYQQELRSSGALFSLADGAVLVCAVNTLCYNVGKAGYMI